MDMENQKKMNITTRSKGLLKKASELATLCGIDVCLLFYDGFSSSTAPALTFPSDASQVSRILSVYRSHTGPVKDETHKYLPPQRIEPQIVETPIDCPAETHKYLSPQRTEPQIVEMPIDCPAETVIEKSIDCAVERWIDEDPIGTLMDLVDELFAKAERIASGEKEIRSFLRREEALRKIVDELGVMLFSVRNRILGLLSS